MRSRVTCPECRKVIAWPIDNPAGPFCPECGGLIGVVDNKPTERAPLLSDEALMDIVIDKYGGTDSYTQDRCFAVAEAVRDLFNAKITSGELRVVKKAKVDASIPGFIKCSCGVDVRTDEWIEWNYCPGCGAQIVKE